MSRLQSSLPSITCEGGKERGGEGVSGRGGWVRGVEDVEGEEGGREESRGRDAACTVEPQQPERTISL